MEVNPNKIIENISATCRIKITPHEINRKTQAKIKNDFVPIFFMNAIVIL
ncbi:hypothetical protein Eco16F5M1D1_2575 [Escherichia coli O8:H8]|nr:hypothetical protein Eco16F5M1D1_2575 [Escherichia coli O8:H8]